MMDITMMQALCIPPALRSDLMFHHCSNLSVPRSSNVIITRIELTRIVACTRNLISELRQRFEFRTDRQTEQFGVSVLNPTIRMMQSLEDGRLKS